MAERDFFIDNLLVRIHVFIEIIWWTGLTPWDFEFPSPGSLISTFLSQVALDPITSRRAANLEQISRGLSHFQYESLEHRLSCSILFRQRLSWYEVFSDVLHPSDLNPRSERWQPPLSLALYLSLPLPLPFPLPLPACQILAPSGGRRLMAPSRSFPNPCLPPKPVRYSQPSRETSITPTPCIMNPAP